MYKVNVLSVGKYDNVAIGERYILTKRKARNFIKLIKDMNCNFQVEKFICCSFGFYYWSKEEAKEDNLF